jgi:hypothetical protein
MRDPVLRTEDNMENDSGEGLRHETRLSRPVGALHVDCRYPGLRSCLA